MRLLVDAHCFDYDTSEGINTYIRGLYGELTKMATDIDFFFAAHHVERIREMFGDADNVHYVKLKSENKIWRLLGEFPGLIRKYGIDAVHYQYASPLVKNCFTIVTLHDILFKDFPEMFPKGYRMSRGALFKMSAKRADMLCTVSEYSRERISHYYGIAKERIVVTRNGVSDDFFSIDREEARRFVQSQGIGKYVLYVSRIEPRKNHVAVVRAFHEMGLWKQGYHLVMIGRKTLPTPLLDECLSAMAKEVRDCVHVYNQVDYEQLKLWYGAASLFVYPALVEGFGIPPIEAGAAGVPCICNNRTAMGDFTFFGDNLIDIDNSKMLSKAIAKNLDHGSNTARIKEAIRERYNWRASAKAFHKALKNRM